MSIRSRILLACLALTTLTTLLGLFMLRGEQRVGGLAMKMYDQSFMSVDYFRSAQIGFFRLKSLYALDPDGSNPKLSGLNADIVDDLDIATQRATSEQAREVATELHARVLAIAASAGNSVSTVHQLDDAAPLFEQGGEQFAQDGFADRLQAEQISHDSEVMSEFAIGVSLGAAVLVTFTLTRSIVPPLRQATIVAHQIAQGNLENRIALNGSSEILMLLSALGVMQVSLRERRAAAERIEHMAQHDPLTNLANRVGFGKAMKLAVAEARQGTPFTLLLLDLDRFKAVNDTFGHPAGDAVLCMVASRMLRCVRENDLVARLGGDEFAILQRTAVCHRNEQMARRLIAVLSSPYTVDGRIVSVGASIGIATSFGESDADDLHRAADLALYQAKAAGRGTWRFFQQDQENGVIAPEVPVSKGEPLAGSKGGALGVAG